MISLTGINRKTMKKIAILQIMLCTVFGLPAQEIPDPMQPPRMVNDFSGLLESTDRDRLESKLQEFYYQTSTQIYVVVLDDISGYDIAEYTALLGEQWGVGTRENDNGAVILLNPGPDRKTGDVYIATGYGLEGAIPDALAKRIVELDMLPSFRQQNYYAGLDGATTSMMDLARGEYTADEYLQRHGYGPGSGIPAFAIVILFVIVFSILGRRRSARQYALGHNIPFWLALFMVSGARGSHRGSFGNFSSGGGSFGGFGGGFGGGGGGSFGGGGAGGSW
jgi:uncharacterized protein